MNEHPKLLLVEDEEDLLEVWTSLLNMAGKYSVKAVNSGSQALEVVSVGYRPDVLLTDFYLGDSTGLELAAEMRKRIGSLAVIVATGNDENSALTKQAENGDIALLIKPVRFADLTAAIEQQLAAKAPAS